MYNYVISLQPTFKDRGHFPVTDSFYISGSVGSQLAGHYGRGESREGGKWAGVEGGLAACKYGGEKKNGYLLLLVILLSLIYFSSKLTDPVKPGMIFKQRCHSIRGSSPSAHLY